jgi:endonuclease/exonuclease/phosphatase family metal-dependent hydrolase
MSDLSLRIVCWNIEQGENLHDVAMTLYHSGPWDLVLLNEICRVRRFFFPDLDQTEYIANALNLQHWIYGSITGLTGGLAGTKGVAVLSRYPITSHRVLWVPYPSASHTSTGTLQTTVQVGDQSIAVFSTRFHPLHTPDHPLYESDQDAKNAAGHEQALGLIRGVPDTDSVIFGGDLNARWDKPWATDFRDRCGLVDVMVQHPRNGVDLADRVDYIYYRTGRYNAVSAAMWGSALASDHTAVSTHLLKDNAVLIPYATGMSLAEASARITGAGLTPEYTGPPRPDSWLTWKQQPNYLEMVARGSKVTLFLRAPDQVIVPYVINDPVQVAADTLRELELVPKFQGQGEIVASQRPLRNTLAGRGATVTMGVKPGPIPFLPLAERVMRRIAKPSTLFPVQLRRRHR